MGRRVVGVLLPEDRGNGRVRQPPVQIETMAGRLFDQNWSIQEDKQRNQQNHGLESIGVPPLRAKLAPHGAATTMCVPPAGDDGHSVGYGAPDRLALFNWYQRFLSRLRMLG